MNQDSRFSATVALVVAFGGFQVGFAAAALSRFIGFIGGPFGLMKNEPARSGP